MLCVTSGEFALMTGMANQNSVSYCALLLKNDSNKVISMIYFFKGRIMMVDNKICDCKNTTFF